MEEMYTPEQDITETGADGVERLVAPAGIPVPMADAKARGWVKEAKTLKPAEAKPAESKTKETK